MGFEPNADFAATGALACGCVMCQECRAALALQTRRFNWRELALIDTDLQWLTAEWSRLPTAIRGAITALARSQQP